MDLATYRINYEIAGWQKIADERGHMCAPFGAVLAVNALCDEVERLYAVLEKVNKYADHLGMSLRDVKRERDELRDALDMVCKIECVDDLWKAQEALAKVGADKTGEGS